MKIVKTKLFDNEWLSLMSVKKEGISSGYVYSHETRCNGIIVAFMPFRKNDNVQFGYDFLLRKEVTPCWGFEPHFSSFTGGYEKDKGVEETVIMELHEEAGYQAETSELINLGESFASKSADTVYKLFAIDVTEKKQGEAKGDGSVFETLASNRWFTDVAFSNAKDPQVYVLFFRLMHHLGFDFSKV